MGSFSSYFAINSITYKYITFFLFFRRIFARKNNNIIFNTYILFWHIIFLCNFWHGSIHTYPVATGLPFVAQSDACLTSPKHSWSSTNTSPMRRSTHVIWCVSAGRKALNVWNANLSKSHALQFQRQLGLGRYETAFQMLHKLRAAMARPNQDGIGGEWPVELDETWVGGHAR